MVLSVLLMPQWHDNSSGVGLDVGTVEVLQDTDEGRNKSNDNPANTAKGTETSSGACISARRTSISADITSNSDQDRVSSDTLTGPTTSH